MNREADEENYENMLKINRNNHPHSAQLEDLAKVTLFDLMANVNVKKH